MAIASAAHRATDTRMPLSSNRTRSAAVTRSLSSTIRMCVRTGGSVGLSDGDGEGEAASFTEFALHPDPASMQLDEPAGDRQAESRPVVTPRCRGVDLCEFAE